MQTFIKKIRYRYKISLQKNLIGQLDLMIELIKAIILIIKNKKLFIKDLCKFLLLKNKIQKS